MLRNKIRKEISLDGETIALLQLQAEREGRKLKNYMEYILKKKSNDFELTDEYKLMMDELLEKYETGKLKSFSKSEFLKRIIR